MTHGIMNPLRHRVNLTSRLIVALEHLSQAVAISVVSAYVSLDVLEEIVRAQEKQP